MSAELWKCECGTELAAEAMNRHQGSKDKKGRNAGHIHRYFKAWYCPVCGPAYSWGNKDIIVEHMQDAEHAGNPVHDWIYATPF